MFDKREMKTRLDVTADAIKRIESARRAIVDIRLPRQDEQELLESASEMLDKIERHYGILLDEDSEPPEA